MSGKHRLQAYHEARDNTLAQFERVYVKAAISRASGNIAKAARLAGVDRTTFYRIMERVGVERGLLSTATTDAPDDTDDTEE